MFFVSHLIMVNQVRSTNRSVQLFDRLMTDYWPIANGWWLSIDWSLGEWWPIIDWLLTNWYTGDWSHHSFVTDDRFILISKFLLEQMRKVVNLLVKFILFFNIILITILKKKCKKENRTSYSVKYMNQSKVMWCTMKAIAS